MVLVLVYLPATFIVYLGSGPISNNAPWFAPPYVESK